MRCGRTVPHGPHQWSATHPQRDPYYCQGLPPSVRPQTLPVTFTLQEDARAGDVLELDQVTGRLRLYLPVLEDRTLSLEAALEYGWALYETADVLSKVSGATFAQAATSCVEVSDAYGRGGR